VALARVGGVGSVLYRRVYETFGSAAAAFTQPMEALAAVPGLTEERARAIVAFDGWEEVEAELARAESLGLRCLVWGEAQYPPLLAAIYDPPPVLYYKGSVDPWPPVAVAVVGTRRPTDYGERATARLAGELAEGGVAVVSGLARGIDASAHRAALEAGGFTIAVLGCGADVVYPPENAELYEAICERGVVLSEFPPATRPEAPHFPRRNRIISGLAAGVLVVEAGVKSGALITAALAADQGREVFAVPGSIFSPASDGCRRLIARGAKPVGSVEEILEEIAPQFMPEADRVAGGPPAPPPDLGPDETELLPHVGVEPTPADDLAARAAWEPARVAAALLNLEIAGLVEKLPGNCYRRLFV